MQKTPVPPSPPVQQPPPPVQQPPLSPEDREKRAILVAGMQKSITKFDELVKPNPNITFRVKY